MAKTEEKKWITLNSFVELPEKGQDEFKRYLEKESPQDLTRYQFWPQCKPEVFSDFFNFFSTITSDEHFLKDLCNLECYKSLASCDKKIDKQKKYVSDMLDFAKKAEEFTKQLQTEMKINLDAAFKSFKEN